MMGYKEEVEFGLNFEKFENAARRKIRQTGNIEGYGGLLKKAENWPDLKHKN